MSEHKEPIPSRIYNAAVGGHICGTEDIIDDTLGKTQKGINEDIMSAIGTGGTVDEKIAVETQRATAVEEELRTLYNNLQQSQPIPVTSLPATGEAGKIYRLAGTTSYADYMYAEGALTTPIKMAEYDNAIDNIPTVGSDNLVKSGGVASKLLMDSDMSSHWIDNTILYGGDPHVGTVEMTGWATTDFITLEAGESIISILGGSNSSYWAFTRWDYETEQFIDGFKGNFEPELRICTVETKCKVRISTSESANPNLICYVRKLGSLFELQRLIENIQPAEDKSVWKGKKVGFLGDSTSASSTSTYVENYVELTGCLAQNYAMGGTTVADNGQPNPMCTRFTVLPSDLDMVLILGGVNDFRSGVPLGNFEDFNEDGSLNYTFYGALHTLIRGLKTNFLDKPIVYMTPMHNNYMDSTYGDTGEYNYNQLQLGKLVENKFPLNNGNVDETTATGGTLSEYILAIKKVCSFYGIPVIDLHDICGIQPIIPANKTQYLPDGIHPTTQAGGKRMAEAVYPYLEQIYQ